MAAAGCDLFSGNGDLHFLLWMKEDKPLLHSRVGMAIPQGRKGHITSQIIYCELICLLAVNSLVGDLSTWLGA